MPLGAVGELDVESWLQRALRFDFKPVMRRLRWGWPQCPGLRCATPESSARSFASREGKSVERVNFRQRFREPSVQSPAIFRARSGVVHRAIASVNCSRITSGTQS